MIYLKTYENYQPSLHLQDKPKKGDYIILSVNDGTFKNKIGTVEDIYSSQTVSDQTLYSINFPEISMIAQYDFDISQIFAWAKTKEELKKKIVQHRFGL